MVRELGSCVNGKIGVCWGWSDGMDMDSDGMVGREEGG